MPRVAGPSLHTMRALCQPKGLNALLWHCAARLCTSTPPVSLALPSQPHPTLPALQAAAHEGPVAKGLSGRSAADSASSPSASGVAGAPPMTAKSLSIDSVQRQGDSAHALQQAGSGDRGAPAEARVAPRSEGQLTLPQTPFGSGGSQLPAMFLQRGGSTPISPLAESCQSVSPASLPP